LQAYTLFKLYQRPTITIEKQQYIVTSLTDVIEAKRLFDEIAQTTKTGTDKKILDFYEKYVKTQTIGAGIEALVTTYNIGEESKSNPISDQTIRFWLKRLNRLGWVQIKKGEDITDKRKATFYPLKFSESSIISETEIDLKLKLEKDFDSWLQTIIIKGVSTIEFFRVGESVIKQPVDQLKNFIVGEPYPSNIIVSTPEQQLKPENQLKTISENQIIPDSLNNQAKTEKRFCKNECKNANINDCAKGSYCFAGEVPLNCTKYDYVGALA
jgi:hypothetical protein